MGKLGKSNVLRKLAVAGEVLAVTIFAGKLWRSNALRKFAAAGEVFAVPEDAALGPAAGTVF